VSATAGPGSITASWTAPVTDNGSPITGYTVAAAPVGGGSTVSQAFSSAATTETLGGLAPATAYDVTVTATNAIGTGPSSSAFDNPVTTPTTAGAPTDVQAVAERGAAALSWTAPTSNGGQTVTGYKIVPTPACPACGGLSTTGTTSVVTGLHNGTKYTFTVEAVNQVGTGSPSTPVGPVTPSTKAPLFTSAASRTVSAGHGFNIAVTAKGKPAPVISVVGQLPSWAALTVVHGKAKLTCVPPTGTTGSFTWTYKAVNKAGQATQSFTLTVTG
jgi:hypothetical protein